jgi:hypothetical protein
MKDRKETPVSSRVVTGMKTAKERISQKGKCNYLTATRA